MTATDRTARRLAMAAGMGAGAGLFVLTWFALRGSVAAFDHLTTADFYETQARSLMHGHWDGPADAYSFERFRIGGRFFTYFGPWPALLRLPFVALFGHHLDGRLSRVAMVAACALTAVAVARIALQARRALRGRRELLSLELVALAGFVFVAVCGSPMLFLAGWTAVYHEAIAWGVAWALVSTGYLVAHLETGRRRDLVAASAAAACSVLSRGSVGFGPIAAIGFLLATRSLDALRVTSRERRGGHGRLRPHAAPWATVAVLTACLVVPIGLYGAVNQAKFGTPFGLPPYEKQDLLADWPTRQPALDANGGTLFGPGYAPTILLQYLRPDGIGFDRLFPWITFSGPPTVVGDSTFEALNNSVSLPAVSPLLVVLALVGMAAAFGRRARVFRAPLAGAAIGCVGALSLAFVDERYQGDFLPLIIPAAAVGAWWLVAAVAPRSRRWKVAGATLAVLAAAWSCGANAAIALTYQRLYRADVTTAERADFIGVQLTVQRTLDGGLPSRVQQGDAPPAPSRPGTLFVQGACDAVLWSDGKDWHPVETTAATGSYPLRIDLADPTGSGPEPVLTTRDGTGTGVVWLERTAPDRVVLTYRWEPTVPGAEPSFAARGETSLLVERGRPFDVLVHLDRRGVVGTNVTVTAAGRTLLQAYGPLAISPPVLAAQDVMAGVRHLDGAVTLLADSTPICNRLVALGLSIPR